MSLTLLRFHQLCSMFMILFFCGFIFNLSAQDLSARNIPYLEKAPQLDGDLSEWKNLAFHDGIWDLNRVKESAWFEPKRNRLNIDSLEDTNSLDLSARYYIAWDQGYLYFGAEVQDNVHDVSESNHESKRWYYKDAIALFFEAPRDSIPEKFGFGDHAFCFVIDTLKPDYGAWWRHGNTSQTYIEEPLPLNAVEYSIKMNPWKKNEADYILEARVDMQATFMKDDAAMTTPKVGEIYSMMIVHCDPDGGEYGGHLLIYGKGDDDSTWGEVKLVGPKSIE